MSGIRILEVKTAPELWASSMLPGGILERWLVADGVQVNAGDALAMVRIEDALHELVSPGRGVLTIEMKASALVEPGAVIARVSSP